MRIRLYFIYAAVVTLIVACDSDSQIANNKENATMTYRQEIAEGWQDWAQRSEMGLTMAIPPGRAVEVHATRIDLNNTSTHRTVDVISLYPNSSPPPVSIGDGIVRGQGEQPAPFTVRENSGGSGGANYTLLTTKTVDGQAISLLATLETESGIPSFSEAWGVWESLRLEQ